MAWYGVRTVTYKQKLLFTLVLKRWLSRWSTAGYMGGLGVPDDSVGCDGNEETERRERKREEEGERRQSDSGVAATGALCHRDELDYPATAIRREECFANNIYLRSVFLSLRSGRLETLAGLGVRVRVAGC